MPTQAAIATQDATLPSGRIELQGLSKHFPNGAVAVRDATLTIEPGELMVFLGPSGCGKTTTLRMIAGLEDITGGQILLDNEPIAHLPPEDRNVSMVFQDLALYPNMTVRRNIAFPLRARRQKPKLTKFEIDERVDQRAAMVGISDLLERRVSELSGGQRQRVALARALVREPIAFLLDEAFASLDAVLRREFWTEFKRFQRQIGTMMIHVTHDQEEAMVMADRIAVFSDGEIVQVGTPDEIFQRPVSRYVAQFVGSPPMNMLPLKVTSTPAGHTATGLGIETQLPGSEGATAGDDVVLGIRPQRVRWGRAQGPGEVDVPVEVTLVESVGAHKVVLCRVLEGDDAIEIRSVVYDDDVAQEGETGHVRFRLANAVLISGGEPTAKAQPWPISAAC